jgi:hypothetical protein
MRNKSYFSALGRGVIIAVASLFLAINFSVAAPAGNLDLNHPEVRAVIAVQDEVTPGLMQRPGILGTAVGLDAVGNPALVIYIDRDVANVADLIRSLPANIRGIGVQVDLTDKFRAMQVGIPTLVAGHAAKQTAPIQLGTSGGWSKDLANGYCCGGTLGSLISIGGVQYILSNYHVFEADIVPGGNGTVATNGDPIIQPGLIDNNCAASGTNSVATLVKRSSLPNSNVDCSTGQVVPGMVASDGSILEIGPLSSQIVGAALSQKVKKSGRTTGLTRSTVSGLNATVSVAYENECAGGTAFTKTFTGQIVIQNLASQFLNSGDSGSLLVEDVTTRPHAVGLCFAGSATQAIANPIGEVLNFLGATMVGN